MLVHVVPCTDKHNSFKFDAFRNSEPTRVRDGVGDVMRIGAVKSTDWVGESSTSMSTSWTSTSSLSGLLGISAGSTAADRDVRLDALLLWITIAATVVTVAVVCVVAWMMRARHRRPPTGQTRRPTPQRAFSEYGLPPAYTGYQQCFV